MECRTFMAGKDCGSSGTGDFFFTCKLLDIVGTLNTVGVLCIL